MLVSDILYLCYYALFVARASNYEVTLGRLVLIFLVGLPLLGAFLTSLVACFRPRLLGKVTFWILASSITFNVWIFYISYLTSHAAWWESVFYGSLLGLPILGSLSTILAIWLREAAPR